MASGEIAATPKVPEGLATPVGASGVESGSVVLPCSFRTVELYQRRKSVGNPCVLALAGGWLESVSFFTGIRALVVLVGRFYLMWIRLAPRNSTLNIHA